MKSEWKVSMNVIGGEKAYQVYRLLDVQKVDHSGNRQVVTEIWSKEGDAQAIAEFLNRSGMEPK